MKTFTNRKNILADREFERTMFKNKPNIIFIDAGDELVCDFCNAEIVVETDYTPIMLIDDYAICKDCEEKSKD